MVGFWADSGICWTMYKQSAPRSRQITTPTPHHSIFTGQMLFLMPNQHCQSTEGMKMQEYRVGQKNGLFSDLITLWRLVLERQYVKIFTILWRKKVQNSHFSEFKYSLPNLLKSSQQLKLWYIWPEHVDFTQFTLTYSETTVIFPQS